MIVLVDAPNVRRSLWPNLSPERLVEPAQTFYVAEDYHQQYLEKRGRSTCTPALQRQAV